MEKSDSIGLLFGIIIFLMASLAIVLIVLGGLDDKLEFCKKNGYDGSHTKEDYCFKILNDSTLEKRYFSLVEGKYYWEEKE